MPGPRLAGRALLNIRSENQLDIRPLDTSTFWSVAPSLKKREKLFFMRIFILALLLFTMFAGLSAQDGPVLQDSAVAAPAYQPPMDISGTWVGALYQDAGGIADEFEFNMEIRQIGPSINGTSYVKLGDIWAEMEFSGFLQANGSWKINEFRVVRAEKPEALSWCMKRFLLTLGYTKRGLLLSGPWWGNSQFGPCVPGSVRLERKTKRA